MKLRKRDKDDFYVEPSWCSERLFAVERFEGLILDPACGSGRIVKAARAAGLGAMGTDKVDRGALDWPARNFLSPLLAPGLSNIVSNPPFGLAEAFVERALMVAERKVAFLLPTIWLHGDKRARWLRQTPLRCVYLLCPRPSMPPGKVLQRGAKATGGMKDYCWLVWLRGFQGAPEVRWLHRDVDTT
jgi:hypothetical protein